VLRTDEPTGTAETLVGRINLKDMGSRVTREAPKELDKRKAKSAKLTSADEVERSIRRQQERTSVRFGAADVLESVAQMEGLRYRPRTAETREVYELLLGLVHQTLGDQTQEVVRSATDAVLETLKSEDLKEFDKRKDVEGVLGGGLKEETWSQLINLSKKVTDYGEEEEGPTGDDRERAVDNEGVAVLFEDEEEDEEGDAEFEVKGRDSDEESDEDEEGDEEDEEEENDGAMDEDDALVLGRGEVKAKAKSDKVSPYEVDAFWLQRTIASFYPDPVQSADFTAQALDFLGSEMELRDLENSLAEMFGYENFELVTLLTKNREVIVWCTKLARSNDDEKQDVEVAMREKGVGWMLRELRGDRKVSAAQVAEAVNEVAVPTKANLAPGSVAQPRRVIDIDSLIFSEGGHLMSRKKVKLPEGSFKRQMKGYEEIHVPEPKRREAQQNEWMPVAKMPDWTQPVWASVKAERLNPIQTRVFPIAFESSEPMLICAPTGAGKVSPSFPVLVLGFPAHEL
jgi:pre-mRNA-splicing helicase BRR2